MKTKLFVLASIFVLPQVAFTQETENKPMSQAEYKRSIDAIVAQPNTSTAARCDAILEATKKAMGQHGFQESPASLECRDLAALSGGQIDASITPKETVKRSVDEKIICQKHTSYTIDYDDCERSLSLYNTIYLAEKGMDMQQTLRTQYKGQKLQQETVNRINQGDSQEAAYDGQISMQEHMKGINKEKIGTYTIALAALVKAVYMFPSKKAAVEECNKKSPKSTTCEKTVGKHITHILGNEQAKGQLQIAIADFAAKAAAAGFALENNDNAINNLTKVKDSFQVDDEDLMLERCQFDINDPACSKTGNRVSTGGNIQFGEFDMGGSGATNSFDLNPGDNDFGEIGKESEIDDQNEVSSINSPFANKAKIAKKILDPAAAAQMQPTGGAGGGTGGAAGGGMGGGGASLGSDLQGADKDTGEAQIKAGKVSGSYAMGGGEGFKGVARGKEDANPFGSLFDQKSEGGVEEDRSIASEDIGGKTSGLFQTISKSYIKAYSAKRIEEKNLD